MHQHNRLRRAFRGYVAEQLAVLIDCSLNAAIVPTHLDRRGAAERPTEHANTGKVESLVESLAGRAVERFDPIEGEGGVGGPGREDVVAQPFEALWRIVLQFSRGLGSKQRVGLERKA